MFSLMKRSLALILHKFLHQMNGNKVEQNDKEVRLSWTVGSDCSIYAKLSTHKQHAWFPGEIVSIISDDDNKMQDQLIIRIGWHYGTGKGVKLPRNSSCIKPLIKYKTLSLDSALDTYRDTEKQNSINRHKMIKNHVFSVISYWIKHFNDTELQNNYHLDLNHLIFNYCTNYVYMKEYDHTQNIQILNNGTIIKFKSSEFEGTVDPRLDYIAVISDVGFSDGINSYSVQLTKHKGFIWAIGFIEKSKDLSLFKLYNYKHGVNTGIQYFMNSFGYVGRYYDDGLLYSVKRIGKRNNNDDDGDTRIKINDIILITLDLNKGEIRYEINNQLVYTQPNIEKNRIYYPASLYGTKEKDEEYECQFNVKCCLY
eukprot:113598_1